MMLRDLDLNKLSKLASQQVDHVTCIECCKYYTVPTTASCGHTLCHSCWRGRRNCASCGKQIEKKNLKLNIPLQNLREHVSALSDTFEDLFNIKLDEFLLDSPAEIIPEPNKNVKEWLASSQNQFSAPVTSSTQSTQEHIQSVQITSDIQIHTSNNRLSDHREVVHVPLQQDDWDKIEKMPDAEKNTNKNQKNFVGPMDIEPFEFMMDDEEYTSNNPRRSSRQKENKTGTPSLNHDGSPQKNSEDSNKDSENKFLKVAKNWNNVKRMKKEFSKLNKQNRNKLNVSIELCKKNLIVNKEVPSITPEKLLPIDDNTPTIITSTENDDPVNNDNKVIEKYKSINEHVDMNTNEHTFRNTVNTINKTSENIADVNKKEAQIPQVSFIKKSTLQNKPLITDNIQIEADKPSTANTVNNDDIEITIKIGNTLTNICIKKKDNDVQLKIHSDREVQTSLGHCSFNKRQISSTIIDVNNLEHSKSSENIVNSLSAPKVTVTQKSLSKKNTASAETTTAQLEITESIEREMTKSLDFNEMSEIETNKKNSNQNISQDIRGQSQRPLRMLEEIPEDMDLDIFDSESVKVGNVMSLKSTKNTPSVILPSINTAKLRTPLTNDKRDREQDDVFDFPISKKVKLALNKVNTSIVDKRQKDVITDNDQVNDELMGQVVKNVDTYMENFKNKSNNIKEINSSQINNRVKNMSQIIEKSTSQRSFLKNSISSKNPKAKPDDKCSENIFSVLENDSEMLKSFDYKTQTHSQHHTTDKSNTTTELDVMELCTPVQDEDSDKSVVEDTPQKSTSFSKKKNTNETTIQNNTNINITMKPNLKTRQAQNKQKNTNPEDINIISLSDTFGDSSEKSKNITVLETEPRIAMETPVTITKFVDQIKHKSTPMARKSLNFNNENCDPELTICPSSFVVAQTTQEKEFLSKAFEHTLESEKCVRNNSKVLKLCLAGSCLSTAEQSRVRFLCSQKNWTYIEKYTKDLTHLVVGVDEENKSQRSVKYMCALAAGKWIISYEWIEKCLETNDKVDEEQFEALDGTGEPGPRRSRLAKQKLFTGISFFCMPPFSVLDVNTLKDILIASGGCVVSEAHAAHAGERPALLLAEPEHTQEDRFIYIAMELTVVPVNYEWVLNCLGSYSLESIYELLLCPASLLPPVVSKWPPELISRDE